MSVKVDGRKAEASTVGEVIFRIKLPATATLRNRPNVITATAIDVNKTWSQFLTELGVEMKIPNNQRVAVRSSTGFRFSFDGKLKDYLGHYKNKRKVYSVEIVFLKSKVGKTSPKGAKVRRSPRSSASVAGVSSIKRNGRMDSRRPNNQLPVTEGRSLSLAGPNSTEAKRSAPERKRRDQTKSLGQRGGDRSSEEREEEMMPPRRGGGLSPEDDREGESGEDGRSRVEARMEDDDLDDAFGTWEEHEENLRPIDSSDEDDEEDGGCLTDAEEERRELRGRGIRIENVKSVAVQQFGSINNSMLLRAKAEITAAQRNNSWERNLARTPICCYILQKIFKM